MKSHLPSLSTIDISPQLDDDTNIITAYTENSISIISQKITSNCILSKQELHFFDSISDVVDKAGKIIAENSNSVIIYGTNNLRNADYIEEKASSANINIEFMALASAIRTYNILLQDGRDVHTFFELNSIDENVF